MLFQTSTPKKRTLTPLPRSSTPKTFSNLIKDNYQPDIVGDKLCRPMIKLDSLLYRPKTESHHHRHHRQHHKQSWDI
ncbi:unnamed protein product [Adineta ricciae]|uniref:Uncharacterized protein n=1 Tax=Adineta ricciae TaxID=249248 RepID=A0A814YZY1_ADIRI|nr:unnamed protein product [Adineta ricciae]